MHHYVYLVNRFNLKESTDEMIRRLKEVSDEYGRDYEIIVNETPEEAGAVMSRFQDTEYIITAIGGQKIFSLSFPPARETTLPAPA